MFMTIEILLELHQEQRDLREQLIRLKTMQAKDDLENYKINSIQFNSDYSAGVRISAGKASIITDRTVELLTTRLCVVTEKLDKAERLLRMEGM